MVGKVEEIVPIDPLDKDRVELCEFVETHPDPARMHRIICGVEKPEARAA
jgi:hypothetical protein